MTSTLGGYSPKEQHIQGDHSAWQQPPIDFVTALLAAGEPQL